MRTTNDLKLTLVTLLQDTLDKIDSYDEKNESTHIVAYSHRKKNLEILIEYLATHKVEVQRFIENDLRNRG